MKEKIVKSIFIVVCYMIGWFGIAFQIKNHMPIKLLIEYAIITSSAPLTGYLIGYEIKKGKCIKNSFSDLKKLSLIVLLAIMVVYCALWLLVWKYSLFELVFWINIVLIDFAAGYIIACFLTISEVKAIKQVNILERLPI